MINRPVDTRTLILRIVQGLTASYDSIRDNLVLASDNYDSISKLRAALLALEVAKVDQKGSKLQVGLAAQHQTFQRFRGQGRGGGYGASTSGRPKAGSSSEFNGNCNHCGQPGHRQADCKLRVKNLPEQPEVYAAGFPKSGVLGFSLTSSVSVSQPYLKSTSRCLGGGFGCVCSHDMGSKYIYYLYRTSTASASDFWQR